MVPHSQPAILDPAPTDARFLVFDMPGGGGGVDPRRALARLRESGVCDRAVVGIGLPLALALGKGIPGLRAFPGIVGPGVSFPSTQGAIWAYICGAAAGEVYERTAALRAALEDGLVLTEDVAAFRYREGRDLSGYVDGTANPVGEGAVEAAIVSGKGPGLDGASFVAVQKYVHDLERFAGFSGVERDAIIGRRISDNAEMADAPPSAHVKRAEQESFDPPAFIVRRSMPWADAGIRGLYFVAYGESIDRFERVLARMSGRDDGVVDGLMRFTRAVSGGYYWCPPVREGRLDWSALGL